jgi:hypothetical protein
MDKMPVQKFKTFEDAEKAVVINEPNEAYFKRVAQLFRFANKLNPIKWPRGIFKFKTIEDANQYREKIERAFMLKKQEEMKRF